MDLFNCIEVPHITGLTIFIIWITCKESSVNKLKKLLPAVAFFAAVIAVLIALLQSKNKQVASHSITGVLRDFESSYGNKQQMLKSTDETLLKSTDVE